MTSPRGISDVTTRDAVRLTEFLLAILILTFSAQTAVSQASPAANAAPTTPICDPTELGSPYIPVDSWVYPAMLRLYSLGFVDHVYLNMRPWTHVEINMIYESQRIEPEHGWIDPTVDGNVRGPQLGRITDRGGRGGVGRGAGLGDCSLRRKSQN